MITREEAIEELRKLIYSELFSEYIDDAFENIIYCLKAEDELGFDVWGVREQLGNDFYKLLRGEKLEDEKALKSLYAKYHRSNRWSGNY